MVFEVVERLHLDGPESPLGVRVMAMLFAASGLLGLLWIALADHAEVEWGSGIALVVFAIAVAVALWRRGDRPVPTLLLELLAAGGILAVSAALLTFGHESPFALFYLWIAPAVVFLVPRGHARWHIALIALSFAGVLLLERGETADLSLWLITVGAVLVSAGTVRTLVRASAAAEGRALRAAQRHSLVAELGQLALSERAGAAPLLDAAVGLVTHELEAQLVEVVEIEGSRVRSRVRLGSLAGAEVHLDAAREPRTCVTEIPCRGDLKSLLVVRSGDDRHLDDADREFVRSVAAVLGAAMAREHAERALLLHGLRDPLTGAATRVLFEDRVSSAMSRAHDEGGKVAVLCLDFDAFAVVNETHGHEGGDHVLRQVPSRIASITPDSTVGRLGGDRFAVLIDSVRDPRDAFDAAVAVAETMRTPFVAPGRWRPITASVGVAVTDGAAQESGRLIRDAEAALRIAKVRAPGTVEIHDETQRTEMAARMCLEEQLRRGIAGDELRLAYQPVVGLADRDLVGVEALVRWEHPDRGLLAPAEFIDVAEQSDLIADLGDWVLQRACEAVRRWGDRVPASFRVSVNVSARQLDDPDFPGRVRGILRRTGVSPSIVAFELTESAISADSARTALAVMRLRQIGTSVLLDDFGTGYASLERIRLLALDGIKLDHTFIAGLGINASDDALVAAALAMADALGLSVIAEGIERADQEAALRRLGCQLGQGFRYGAPVPEAEIEHGLGWLAEVEPLS